MGTIVVIVVAIVLFLIFREVVTWYWKQNEIVKVLKGIDEKLEFIARRQGMLSREEQVALHEAQHQVQKF